MNIGYLLLHRNKIKPILNSRKRTCFSSYDLDALKDLMTELFFFLKCNFK